jgi:hypothetical protein
MEPLQGGAAVMQRSGSRKPKRLTCFAKAILVGDAKILSLSEKGLQFSIGMNRD